MQTATRKNIGAKATTFLIMLLSLLAGCLSFHYIWHFHDEKPFFSSYTLVETIAGVIFIPKMITMLKLINLTIINL
ncbi:hypothetical protein NL350_28250, partial [Klebsiella pneumoniae]|nr:hypothetical protein [Klebsiella pneumoniae]